MLTECSNDSKKLACDILNAHNVAQKNAHNATRRFLLYDAHVAGLIKDGADALSNIKDACNGRPAKRSSYGCKIGKAPGDTVCLDKLILQYVFGLLSTTPKYKLQINSLAGSCHTNNSLHYSGMTVDLQLNWTDTSHTSRDPEQTKAYQDACTAAGGWSHNGTHVHCQIENWKQTTGSQRSDARCKDIGGACRDISISCDNGKYEPGLCAGNSNRQCCVPNAGTYDDGV